MLCASSYILIHILLHHTLLNEPSYCTLETYHKVKYIRITYSVFTISTYTHKHIHNDK